MSEWKKCTVCGRVSAQRVPDGDQEFFFCRNVECGSNGGGEFAKAQKYEPANESGGLNWIIAAMFASLSSCVFMFVSHEMVLDRLAAYESKTKDEMDIQRLRTDDKLKALDAFADQVMKALEKQK